MVSFTRAETKVVVLFYKVCTIFTRINTIGRLSNTLGLDFRSIDTFSGFGKFVRLHSDVERVENNCLAGSHGRSHRANANIAQSTRWGRGAVGSAPRWHRGGRGFESHRLHQSYKVRPGHQNVPAT